MAQRISFAEMKAEQAKMTESWRAEGRLSEAWVVADPEIVEIFSAGVAFGMEVGRRGRSHPGYSPDEWRRALREAMERAAALEVKLETAKEAMQKERRIKALKTLTPVRKTVRESLAVEAIISANYDHYGSREQ